MNATPITDCFHQYRPRPLEIIDSSLREGQQTSLLHDHYKYYFTVQDKQELLRSLIQYGVKFVELFAPNVSSREAEDIQALRAIRDELVVQKGYTFLLAHVRCHPKDVEAAIAAGFDGLNIYFGTSPRKKPGRNRYQRQHPPGRRTPQPPGTDSALQRRGCLSHTHGSALPRL